MKQGHWLALGAVVLVLYLVLRGKGAAGGAVNIGNLFDDNGRFISDRGYGFARGSANSPEPVLPRTWANTAGASGLAASSGPPLPRTWANTAGASRDAQAGYAGLY